MDSIYDAVRRRLGLLKGFMALVTALEAPPARAQAAGADTAASAEAKQKAQTPPPAPLPPPLLDTKVGGGTTQLPTAPRAPTLPELAHAEREATIEWTTGAYYPRDSSELRGHVPVHILRLSTELPVHQRSFFVGGTYEAALGSPASTRAPFVLGGNVELQGRGVWSTSTGLAFGAGLGIMFPTASFDRESRDAFSLASAAIALRPWDYSFFQNGTFAFRPFVDVHDTVGPFIIQFREGLEWTFGVRDDTGQRVFSLATLYVAVRLFDTVALGMEAYQLYIIDAYVADERRAFYAISPSVRMMLRHVQPSIGILRSVGPPFYPATDTTTAMRAGLTLLW
ncbi:hypothetical protein [Pendulispora albinea]|uniref:YaiO family outer membrane beta-barrel protein n=1 Tax=Pendulispora albinea TaxID=2741071 RepID=A0ABZ2LSH6_9BACT